MLAGIYQLIEREIESGRLGPFLLHITNPRHGT
jgi:hypothetical protein